ncbi:diacylglycerol O-acyltransferase [Amycolatopsis arida]|uniref:diacylglycerol O-acyltransferase n=1 Tax=Amycolatopsis arida TaxID=587909 RepID=A0A1I5UZD6_9PSEU|nr:wax ester/triacylglycerol synthase domain-containing protein [Amycolatopsis arida]TDX91074.1 uncharacterized protein DUF1298 [Amycolatopsis arida]SFQ00066.1 diacylglycerol O-acyltransferase [Amycolatopsis arida]
MTSAPWSRPLTGLEHAFVAYEARTPVANVQVGGLALFHGSPPAADWPRFVAARLGGLPVLEFAVCRRGPTLGWVRPEPDLTRHCSTWVAEPDGLPAAVDAIMARRLDRGRPPWQMWLIHGYADDEWALLFKAHHALLDAASIVAVTCRLLATTPDQPATAAPYPPVERTRSAGLLTVLRGGLRYLRAFLPLASRSFTTRGRTGDRRFAWTSVPVARLRALADRHGVTLNDLFLATLASALREWPHTPWRRGPRPVWTLIPVDLHRREGDHTLGNRVANLRVALPCDEQDPRQRLRRVSAATATAKGGGRIGVAAAGMRALPRWFVRGIFALTFSRWHVDLLASNIRSATHQLGYQNAPVTRVVPLGFLPRRHPLAAYFTTYQDHGCVGFAVDSGLPDGDGLCRLWLRALTELEESEELDPLAPRPGSPTRSVFPNGAEELTSGPDRPRQAAWD